MARTQAPLMGTYEVCAYFQCTRAQLGRWRLQDFPEPLADLKAGPVWDSQEVRAWGVDRERAKRGRLENRRLEALRAYRKVGTVAGAARECGQDESTVRRALRELGEPFGLQLRAPNGQDASA